MKPLSLFLITFFFLFFSCYEPKQNNHLDMEINNTKSYITFIDSCWNEKNMNALKTITSEDFIRKINGIQVAKNQSELESHMHVYFKAFPDINVSIKKYFVKDHQLFIQWLITGINTGIYGEFPATGKRIKIEGFTTAHFNNEGKLIEEDVCYNELDLLQQLGYTIKPPILE